jgi:hypothetical protein
LDVAVHVVPDTAQDLLFEVHGEVRLQVPKDVLDEKQKNEDHAETKEPRFRVARVDPRLEPRLGAVLDLLDALRERDPLRRGLRRAHPGHPVVAVEHDLEKRMDEGKRHAAQ